MNFYTFDWYEKRGSLHNPCTGKWDLSDCPENYVHSSAAFYYKGVQGIYPIDNITDLMNIDLSERM